MNLLEQLVSINRNPAAAARELRLRLILMYIAGSSVALASNVILGPFSMDFSPAQLRAVVFVCLPIGIVLCLMVDLFLITLSARPIEKYLSAAAGGETPGADLSGSAFSRAINLPVLSVLRIGLAHVPAGIGGIIGSMLVADATGRMDFAASQYMFGLILGSMNGIIHAIIEYHLVSRLMANTIVLMYDCGGVPGTAPGHGVISVNARIKFFFIYLLIAVLPLVFLGLTLVSKAGNFLAGTGGDPRAMAGELLPWAILFIVISSSFSFLMSYILSREIIDPVNRLVESMKKVEKGDFGQAIPVTTADEFSELFRGFNLMTEGLDEREKIKSKFGKYVSGKVLDGILEKEPELGGEEREVTILFSDIRDYTRMSESMSPAETVDLLNEYFSGIVEIIEKHNGVLDKFIGDAIMAVFGAPLDDPNHAANALGAAADILAQVEEFNARKKKEGAPGIDVGIGISTGRVIVGNIGSRSRMEYTVIGDTVNLASRLETLTKETGHRILFSESTNSMVEKRFPTFRVGTFDIKGKKLPCDVYSIKQ